MVDMDCDVAIIGAGTAGLAAERAARKAGAKTLLIDDRFAGTTCTTVGCMPSKLLIAAANAADNIRKAGVFGIETSVPAIDGRRVMDRLRKERDAFVAATLKSIQEIPTGICVKQRAHFVDGGTLALQDGRNLSSKAFVVATGARPSVPRMFEGFGQLVLTNETIFELRALPRSIAVIGAGPLGRRLIKSHPNSS
jgi:dihydrolipoamide dehydrogenase